jgi:hypothetical protein
MFGKDLSSVIHKFVKAQKSEDAAESNTHEAAESPLKEHSEEKRAFLKSAVTSKKK